MKFTQGENLILNPKRLTPNALSGGFVLLFALLISSILLATGLGISRIMLREIFLASLARESSVAFFAADTGAECAYHWYIAYKFDLPTFVPQITPGGARSIFCNGQAIRDGQFGPLKINATSFQPNVINGSLTSTFSFLTNPQVIGTVTGSKPIPCASVTVTFGGNNPTSNPSSLIIKSKGYNNCNLTSTQTLERALEYTLIIN